MAWWHLPRLCQTLVVNVDDEGSFYEEDRDEDANSTLALALDVDGEGVGHWDGALGRETRRGGSVLVSLTEFLSSPFDPGR